MEVALCPQYFSKWNIRACKQHKLQGGVGELLQTSSTPENNHSYVYSKMEETNDQNTLPSSWMYKSPLFALKKKPEVNLMKKMYNMSKEKYSP